MPSATPAPRRDFSAALNVILVSAMITCLAITFARLFSAFMPGFQFGHLAPLAFLIALEAQLSMRLLDRGPILAGRWWNLAALEAGGLLAFIKAVDLALAGPPAAWEELRRWPTEFLSAFFGPSFFFVFIVLAAAWIVSRILAGDLIELERAQPVRGNESVRDPFENLFRARSSLTDMVMALGAAVVILGVVALHVIPFMTDRPDAGNALGTEVLGFFVFGFALLGFSSFSVQRSSWAFDRVPVSPEMAGRWVRYSLVFLAGVTALAALLPADYSSAFLAALYQVAFAIWSVIAVVVMILLLPISLLMQWLMSLFGRPVEPPPAAEETELPKLAAASTPDYIRAAFFWLIVISLTVYAVVQLIRNRGEIARRIAGARRPYWWSRLTDWVSRRFSRARVSLQRAITERLGGLQRRLRRGGLRPGWDLRLRGLTPRQQVISIYLAMVRRGDEAGLPRRSSQTPLEYGRFLSERLPETAPDSDTLTEAFVDARYTRHETESARAGLARKAWDRLKLFLRPDLVEASDARGLPSEPGPDTPARRSMKKKRPEDY